MLAVFTLKREVYKEEITIISELATSGGMTELTK